MNIIISKSIFVIAALFFLTSCQSKTKNMDKVIDAQELYQSGLKKLTDKKYDQAADYFEQIFFQHPGKEITTESELMQAYALYLAEKYDEAVDILDIFIKLHPRHQYIGYAYYLKALSYYVQISSVSLDQSKTKYAKEALQEVITNFPRSKYAIDAELKLDLVNDHLAGKEVTIGRYYLKRNNPIASIRRFQTVIKKYDTTSHVPEALYRLIECNMILGLPKEAQKYSDVLSHNYPDNEWTILSMSLFK